MYLDNVMNFYNKDNNTLYDAMETSIRRFGYVQNNIENVNTIGYKSIDPDSAIFSQTMNDVIRDEEQGTFKMTGQKLDLALTRADAFFLVEGQKGPERSRDGQFHLADGGKIVDSLGRELVVLDRKFENDPFERAHKTSDLKISPKGSILIDGEFAGRVAIDYKDKKAGMEAYVLQGKLENSNVDLSQNISKLVQIKRHLDNINGLLSMEMSADKSFVETYGRNV